MEDKCISVFLFVLCIFGVAKFSRVTEKPNGQNSSFNEDMVKSVEGGISVPVAAETAEGTLNLSATYLAFTPETDTTFMTQYTLGPPNDPECQDIATDFVYKKNLCLSTRSPASYLVKARPYYTCTSRCGETPSFTITDDFSQCGCDELCALYGDCCKDMADLCPHQYSKSENPAFPDKNSVSMSSGEYLIVFGSHNSLLTTQTDSPRVSPSYTPAVSKSKTNEEVLPFQPRSVENLASPLGSFEVVDLTTRLLYVDYDTYTSFNRKTSVPIYVPKVAGLDCLLFQSHKVLTVQQILPWCRVTGLHDVITPYHRPIKKHLVQSCLCNGHDLLVDHVHNSCLGRNISQSSMSRHTLWNFHEKYARFRRIGNTKCSLLALTATGSNPYIPKTSRTPDTTVMMRIVPLLHHNVLQSVDTTSDIFSSDVDAKDAMQEKNSATELEVMVEFTNMLEQSFRCPSMQSYLEACQLVRCAAGALLWVEDSSHDRHAVSRSCVLPTQAKISTLGGDSLGVPLCTCFQVISILDRLGLWEINIDYGLNRECLVHFSPLSGRPIYFNEIYTFTRSDPKSQMDSKTLSNLLAATREFCPEDPRQTYEMCFSRDSSVTDTSSFGHCLTWGGMEEPWSRGTGLESGTVVNILVLLMAIILGL